MTDEYKEGLLEYLTGTIKEERCINQEYFKDIKILQNNLQDLAFRNNGNFFLYGYAQSTKNNLILAWGENYNIETSLSVNTIVLLDADFNVLQILGTFSSGVEFGTIQQIKCSIDGQFYMLETAKETGKKRLMIIDLLKKDDIYELSIRKSYYLPNEYQNGKYFYIEKSPSDSKYVFVGSINDDTISILEMQVNVGYENTYTQHIYTTGGNYIHILDCIIVWSQEIQCIVGYYMNEHYNELRFSNETFSNTKFNFSVVQGLDKGKILASNSSYLVSCNNWEPTGNAMSNYIYKVNYDTKSLDIIYKNTYPVLSASVSKIELYKTSNNQLFFYETFPADTQLEEEYNLIAGKIQGENIISKLIDVVNKSSPLILLVSYNYNLYRLGIQNGNKFLYMLQIFNSTNYNGYSYKNQNMLVPNSSEIYSNDEIVFARNLYNISLNENFSVITLEIPNIHSNDIDLTKMNLLSTTNLVLVKNDTVLRKNIYETVLLNFINSIQIVDKHNNKVNREASSYLNKAVNTENNYDRAKLYKKGILYYANGITKEILYEYQNKSGNSVNIVFGLYVNDLLDKLELISNDKKITYQIINLSDLKIGKYYRISQKVEVV